MDLAEGHLAAFKALINGVDELLQLNLGSGQGRFVLEVSEALGHACGQAIPYVIRERRSGDAAISVADPSEAKRHLNWQTRRNLGDILRDGWRWQDSNTGGYASFATV
jgi:UDP-glucose 4-epimerase